MKSIISVYQKYYSSLKAISEIKKDNTFFDNISNLDTFFLEFRNITFVLQKQLETEEEKELYKELKEKYLNDKKMKWMKDTRNSVSKENPFNLKKNIVVDVYYIESSKKMLDFTFSIKSDDLSSNEIMKKIKSKLMDIDTTDPDIFITIKYIFTDEKEEVNIMEYVKYAIDKMGEFLIEFEKKLNINDDKVNCIKDEIKNKIVNLYINNMKLVEDCSFNKKTNEFEFSHKAEFVYVNKNKLDNRENKKIPLKEDNFLLHGKSLEEKFKCFIKKHINIYIMQNNNIVPTFIIIYEDKTFTIESVFIYNKSSVYRKINEIANRIEKQKISSILFVFESIGYNNKNIDVSNLPYTERSKYANINYLSFSMLNKDLKEINIMFNTDKITNIKYVNDKIENLTSNFENITFLPIKNKFKKIQSKIKKESLDK